MLSRGIALVFVLLLPGMAEAMEFQVTPRKGGGAPYAVYGSGPIIPGDATRLSQALQQVSYRQGVGTKWLFLNSWGGSVQEAYRMAEVIDRVGVSAVIALESHICASACTILFIGSRYRMIHEGYLGFHSCYDGVTGIASQFCNEEMANFAMRHGVPHGSVYAFSHYTAPDKMFYMDSDAANCWGITRYEGGPEEGQGQCIDDYIQDLVERCGTNGRISGEQLRNCK